MWAFFQRTEPLPTPPVWVDLAVSVVFGLAGWWLWRRGGRYRSGALVLWFFAVAFAGFYFSS